nr:rifin PIR protein,putative [Plasmodium sp. DRC-Itaito]
MSLCECNLYMPNYHVDPEMKEVIDNINRQTSQRCHEYDDRMKEKRQKCKDRCDKEMQKIILKDKLEKQMEQQLTTLETKIDTNDVPTCACEKSIADKVENNCLKCGYRLDGVASSLGLLGRMGIYALKTTATAAAMEYATKKGIEAGVKAVIAKIVDGHSIFSIVLKVDLSKFITGTNYNSISALVKAVNTAIDLSGNTCKVKTADNVIAFSSLSNGETTLGTYVTAGKKATASETATVKNDALGTIESTTTTCTAPITSSVIAILKKKKKEEKNPIHKNIKRINMFLYFDVDNMFGTCTVFLLMYNDFSL